MKEDNSIHQRHDWLFKLVYRVPKSATNLLKESLSKKAVAEIDWDVFDPVDTAFTSKVGGESRSDLLYKTRLKGGKPLYICIEHQSRADKLMPLRFSDYQSHIIWRHLSEKKGNTVPLVLMVCVYTGHTPYNAPMSLADMASSDLEVRDVSLELMLSKKEYVLADFQKMEECPFEDGDAMLGWVLLKQGSKE